MPKNLFDNCLRVVLLPVWSPGFSRRERSKSPGAGIVQEPSRLKPGLQTHFQTGSKVNGKGGLDAWELACTVAQPR
jgi:hypothetical protein